MKNSTFSPMLVLFILLVCRVAWSQEITLQIQADCGLDSTEVHLSWTPSAEAYFYNVYQETDGTELLLLTTRDLFADFRLANGWTWYNQAPFTQRFFVTGFSGHNGIPTDGLIACFPLDGTGEDIRGGFSGTVFGAIASSNRFMIENECLSFDSVNDYLQILPAINQNHLSVSCWFMLNEELNDGIYSIIRHRPKGFHLFTEVANGETSIGADVWYDAGNRFLFWPHVGQLGSRWYHMLTTYDGFDFKVYLDGDLQYSTGSEENRPMYYEAGGTAVGRDGNYSDRYFDGRIDDIAIYDRGLNEAEVLQLYGAGPFSELPQFQNHATVGEKAQ